MGNKVSSDRLSGYMNAIRTVLKIIKMARYFPDSPGIYSSPGETLYLPVHAFDRQDFASRV
jgi:hypothetical protein